MIGFKFEFFKMNKTTYDLLIDYKPKIRATLSRKKKEDLVRAMMKEISCRPIDNEQA
jgi:hypothetical protein